jgi:phosphatidylinositol alpha-1,6-mannosyltransferase
MRLCIVSTTSHRAVAGLSAYMHGLAEHASAEWDVTNVARFELDGRQGLNPLVAETARVVEDPVAPVSIIAPSTRTAPLLRAVRPMIHHPRTQRLSVRAFDLAYRPALAAAIPAEDAVVHVTGCGWELLGFAAAAIARKRGLPLTVLPAMHPGDWGDSTLDARLYQAADTVFALSHYERDRMVELGVAPERIRVTSLAPSVSLDGDGARFRAAHGIGERPVVLFTGRKEAYKGYPALASAMAIVRRRHPDAVLVAAGAGTTTPSGGLIDLGICDDATKADALAACDVFCMPSAGESFGIVYTEAWAYGKPVVGGPAPAAVELIQDAGGGLTLASQAPEEIAAALSDLLGDFDRRRRLGDSGRVSQRERYTWAEAWRTHLEAWTNDRVPVAA